MKNFSCWRGLVLLLITGFGIASFAQNAGARKLPDQQNNGSHGAKIMGYLALDLNNFQDAVLREKGDHRYLYIQSAGSSQVTVVDVTRRKKPKLAGTRMLADGISLSDANFEGDVAIVPSGSNNSSAVPAKPTSSEISIWDYSKPGSPQLVKKFTGVKKVISGSGNIVYVLNSDGLTIIQVYDQQMRDWDYNTSHIGG